MRAKSWSDFWNSVEVGDVDKCWPWKLYCDARGYGRVKRKGKSYSAHRIAYQLHKGRQIVLEGMCVCHKCDNPPCIPPRKGSENARAKLTEADVIAIRSTYEPRYGALTALAERFGVTRCIISRVVNRQSWKHVP